jgi:hypothetical protein
MMGTIFTNIFGFMVSILIGWWVIAIFVVTSPQERLERTCAPVAWTGKVATSMSMLFNVNEGGLNATAVAFDNATYGCKFTVWRLFYEEDFKKSQAERQKAQEEAEAAAKQQMDVKPGITKPVTMYPGTR